MPKIAALVPMRHHREKLAGKNYQMFAGHLLYHHIINTLLNYPLEGSPTAVWKLAF